MSKRFNLFPQIRAKLKFLFFILEKIRFRIKLLVWRIYGFFSANIVVKTELFKIKVSSKDVAIGRNFYLWGEYGLSEIDKAFEILKLNNLYKNGTLLDIGSNIGHVTLHCLSKKYCSYSICIEPDSFNFQLLLDNVKLNSIQDNVLLVKKGLGANSGKVDMILSQNNFGDHRIFSANENSSEDKYNLYQSRKLVEIELKKLDDLVNSSNAFNNVNFISLDVQGFELEVLKGGVNFFLQGIPIMLEVDPYLLEKKGCDIDTFSGLLCKFYSYFVDLSSMDLRIIEISDFIPFYNNLKESRRDSIDVLFFKQSQN